MPCEIYVKRNDIFTVAKGLRDKKPWGFGLCVRMENVA